MMHVVIYGAPNCPYCEKAKDFVEREGIPYEYVDISQDEKGRNFIVNDMNLRKIPQCFINRRHIGGYESLVAEFNMS